MISLIIPVYNAEKTIKDCLESVASQTYKDYELVIVNDGSQDNGLEIIKSFEPLFLSLGKSFTLIDRQENKGAQATRNEGFSYSRGDYLLFLDADIKLKPRALFEFKKTLDDNKQAGYVYCSHYFGKKLFKFWTFNPEKLKKMPYIHSSSLIKREYFPKSGWDENIKRLQDWDLFLTMLENGHAGVWINQVLFTINPGGTMSSWLPAVFYKIWPFAKSVKKYKQAVEIIKKKHNLK